MGEVRMIIVRAVANGWIIEVSDRTMITVATYVSRDAAGAVEIVAQALRVDAEVRKGAERGGRDG